MQYDYLSYLRNFESVNTIQNRAIRFYLGVHKFAPNVGINGEIGWVTRNICRKVDMIKFWNRLQRTDGSRLLKKVFNWDKRLCKKNWSSEIRAICDDLDILDNFNDNLCINPSFAKNRLFNLYEEQWKREVDVIPKLRFYNIFKTNYATDYYIKHISNRSVRSVLAQFRLGVLPLSIETGRYQDIPIEYRYCLYCSQDCIESEIHFMLFCDRYNLLRYKLFNDVRKKCNLFDYLEPEIKVRVLMSEEFVKFTAKFIHDAFILRKDLTYGNL